MTHQFYTHANTPQHNSYAAAMNSPTVLMDALLPAATITHRRFSPVRLARQLLVFECAPSFFHPLHGKGIVLVELADGRAFFFRTSFAVLRDDQELANLVYKISRLPPWIADWKNSADSVGYMMGVPLEFINKNPSRIENWNIAEWKQQAALWLAINQPMTNTQRIRAITSDRTDELGKELAIKLDDFMQTLDQSAYSLLDRHYGSWLSAHNYFTADNELQRRYRRQADTVFPLVLQQMFACPKDESTVSIIRAIDEGVPLVEHMARLFNCPRKCVRHLVGLRFEDIGIQWTGRLKELLMILGSLDTNRLPKGEHEWNVFGETVDLLSAMTRMPTTSLSSRLLLGELSKLSWSRKIGSSDDFGRRILAIERFAENIRQAIFATIWMNGEKCITGATLQQLVIETACSLGLSRLERLARKWMTEEMRLDTENIIQQTSGLLMLLEHPLEVGDMKVIQLTERTELVSEGIRMGNCIEHYAGTCASGSAYIFSVRDKDGASCVSVEYRLEQSAAGLPELNLIQQKGFENSPPHSRYEEALNVLQRYTTSSATKIKLLNLVIYQKAWKQGGSDRAVKYMRALKFIKFLKTVGAGKLDFEGVVAKAIRGEDAGV